MQLVRKISCKPSPGLALKTFPVLLTLLLATIQESFSQVYDDFTDGEILTDPEWSGNTNHFVVNESGELQLNTDAAGKSWLSTRFSSSPSDALEWTLFIRQSFAPSSSNYGRFYLISDQTDVSGPLNGYFLQFGEAGSNDAVELFRQTGTNRTSVCRGTAGAISSAFAIAVKVQYYPEGRWELSVDYSGGEDYVLESTGNHINTISASYCGLLCTYTVSNATRFYFDDVRIRRIVLPDTIAPSVDSVSITSARSLNVHFSERLEEGSVNAEKFIVSPVPGEAATASLDSAGSTVLLSFNQSFANGEQSFLSVSGIRDVEGNEMQPTKVSFVLFEEHPVAFRDVVFTEILADPTPPVGLPDAEFLELFNRSKYPVNLAGWILSDPSGSAKLPYHILLPGEYVIIAGSDGKAFVQYGETLMLQNFPTLNNAGDRIALVDSRGNAIDSLAYSVQWYRDEDRAAGGWSLERIDPDDLCGEADNWIASEAPGGGTPGKQNSVYARRPDNRGPRILSVVAVDSVTLIVLFNEKLDRSLPSSGNLKLQDGPEVIGVGFEDFSLTGLRLTLSSPLQPGKVYTLLAANVYDCAGNIVDSGHAQRTFLLPQRAAPGDIVVNEVLFNPRPTGVDFVELFNQSAKVLDLQNFSLRNSGSAQTQNFVLTNQHLLVYPGAYLVLTKHAAALKSEYSAGREETFFETDIPPLNDDAGSVALVNPEGVVLDSMWYTDEMHAAFVKEDEGIALERISTVEPGWEPSNWRSASSVSGFATPGYVNSNARSNTPVAVGSVGVEPEVLQHQVVLRDFARIRYRFDRGGMIGNVRIVDQQGRAIRTIAENEMLGTEGFFRWDGDRDNGLSAGIGYYMVWFEVFDADGFVKIFRARIAVY